MCTSAIPTDSSSELKTSSAGQEQQAALGRERRHCGSRPHRAGKESTLQLPTTGACGVLPPRLPPQQLSWPLTFLSPTLLLCRVVELAFVDGKWQPARLSVFNPAPSGAGSVALSGPSTAATPHRSTELKASADGSYRGATDSAAGSGHLSPLRAAPSAARTVGRGVRVPHLPPMQEGNREG